MLDIVYTDKGCEFYNTIMESHLRYGIAFFDAFFDFLRASAYTVIPSLNQPGQLSNLGTSSQFLPRHNIEIATRDIIMLSAIPCVILVLCKTTGTYMT